MKGKVKVWLVRKGYGFISGDDGMQYFAHHSGIKSSDSYRLLIQNQEVEFDANYTQKGPRALNIKPTNCVTEEVGRGKCGNP